MHSYRIPFRHPHRHSTKSRW